MKPETWTAVATIVIAAFTIVLAAVGGVQAWLTRKTINLARDEFISTHRPKIIIHSVELASDVGKNMDDVTAGASVIYFNAGSTAAKVVEITARITRRTFPLKSGIIIGAEMPVPTEQIVGGGKGYIRIFSQMDLEHERVIQKNEPNPRGYVVCIGCIVYEDERGTRRETGFCRRLDALDERWGPVENSEYEYAY